MTPNDEGFKAFRAGDPKDPSSVKKVFSNSYKKDTVSHRNWEFGWNKAYFINLERVKQREEYRRQRTS